MRCSRRESCSRVLTPAFIFKAPGLFVRCCVVVDAVFKSSRTLVHPEVLKPLAKKGILEGLQRSSAFKSGTLDETVSFLYWMKD